MWALDWNNFRAEAEPLQSFAVLGGVRRVRPALVLKRSLAFPLTSVDLVLFSDLVLADSIADGVFEAINELGLEL